MPGRGPAPKATRLKELEGNPGQRPLPLGEPRPEGPPIKPDHLSYLASLEWDRTVNAMPDGVYTVADSSALAAYAQAWGIYLDALAILDAEGLMSVGSRDQLCVHPAAALVAKQVEIIQRFHDRLGMTPGARARLSVAPGQEPKSKFNGLLGGAPLQLVTTKERKGS